MEEQAVESNDTLTSLVDAAEPTLGEGEYFLSDGIKGVGDQPEWYKADKYKSVAEQAKAYTELEKKFGGFTGAPKDGYSLAEGVEADDALWGELVEFGTKQNMSQAAMNEAWALLTAQEQAIEEVSLETEMAKLGDNAVERIKVVEQYMKNNLDSDTYERVRYGVNSAEAVELVEALIKSTAPAKLPIDGYIEPGGITWEDIEAEMFKKHENGQLLRSVDQSHERKIQRMMQEFGGDRPYQRTVG
jgi:cytochrome c556